VRKRTRVIIAVLVVVIALSGVGIAVSLRGLEPRLHEWVTSNLSRSLESQIELGEVHLYWVPLRLHAKKLTVRHHGRTDIPPLLVVSSFTVDLKPTDLWSSTVDRVRVDGLEISIPPKDPGTGKRTLPDSSLGKQQADADGDGMVIRQLLATNTRLSVVPANANKNPKIWDFHELEMKNLRSTEAATFTASVINPIPYGKVEASGTFGPWQSGQPGTTPLNGEYTFDADLGTIEGLGGTLAAIGRMSGTIEQISTTGQTKTADFRLTELDGASLPLQTTYDAVVDGTKGDVELRRVGVTLGRSQFDARGVVEGTKGVKGKRVIVNARSSSANLGELLRLVSKGQPAAEGTVTIDAAMDLPQGKEKVLQRLVLEGSVQADRVRFARDTVQDKIDELSRKAQGRPTDDSIEDVASRMATGFSLRDGVMTYRGLSFDVEGASVHLDGTHSLRSKTIDLSGVVLLTATMSQTQTGFRNLLLKPFDPLFRKNGAGTRLVIKVAGTQDQPKVALQLGPTLKGEAPSGRGESKR
jgi:hypothetical protein